MQKASKKTRSYFANANGLRGFLEQYKSTVAKLLKRGMEQNQISEVTDKLLKFLDKMYSNDGRTRYLEEWRP